MPDLDLDFSFEQDTHQYRTAAGIVRPSVTESLRMGGVFDYSFVPPEVLAAKAQLGTNVHAWTAEYDSAGDADPTALTELEYGYAQAWLAFVRSARPKWLAIEKPMLRPVRGIYVGGTPDRIATIGNRAWVIEIKCTAASHPGWALQTALYEMLWTERADVGILGRMAVRLAPNGKFYPTPYDNPSDAAASIAFIQAATWLYDHNLQPRTTGE